MAEVEGENILQVEGELCEEYDRCVTDRLLLQQNRHFAGDVLLSIIHFFHRNGVSDHCCFACEILSHYIVVKISMEFLTLIRVTQGH